ncbi:hypothetical protein ACLMJK_003382 [Lecanora helva]
MNVSFFNLQRVLSVNSAASAKSDDGQMLPPCLDHTNYQIGRGETGVLTYEPYKSALLPLWRFRTPAIARTSSIALWDAFLAYEHQHDFVGMDMSRKFLQMGMTRAKRYANHKGGRKYKAGSKENDGRDTEVIKVGGDECWDGRKDKEEASAIFREVWERARDYEPYLEMKKEFLKCQKTWEKERKTSAKANAEEDR